MPQDSEGSPNKNNTPVDVVFLQMGGPANLKAVKAFLFNLFSDEYIIQLPKWMRRFQKNLAWLISTFRSRNTRNMYKKIGGGSPILKITNNFIDKVKAELGEGYRTHLIMRYTDPRSKEVVDRLNKLKADRLLLYPLYPHFSKSTTGSSLNDFSEEFWKRYLGRKTRIHWVEDWSFEKFYINWWVDVVYERWQKLDESDRENMVILFSSHALPKKYVAEGDPYEALITESYELIVRKLKEMGVNVRFSLSFQSQVGPVEWIEPSTSEVIGDLAGESISCMFVVPLGFVTDHIETLYEIDILYREEASEVGITNYHMIPPPNNSEKFARGVAQHIHRLVSEEGALS